LSWKRQGIETEVKILGLNAFHGDASAAVLRDWQLMAALEEDWAGLPLLAARACLEGAQRTISRFREIPRLI
jgi:carbamoyltransferase